MRLAVPANFRSTTHHAVPNGRVFSSWPGRPSGWRFCAADRHCPRSIPLTLVVDSGCQDTQSGGLGAALKLLSGGGERPASRLKIVVSLFLLKPAAIGDAIRSIFGCASSAARRRRRAVNPPAAA